MIGVVLKNITYDQSPAIKMNESKKSGFVNLKNNMRGVQTNIKHVLVLIKI